jgi:hypothetical protein
MSIKEIVKVETPVTHSIAFDKNSLDGKILVDDDKLLGYPVIIASEIVQRYDDGYAYKSAESLQKMADSANRCIARPVKILEHPGADTNYLLIKSSDAQGYVTNFQFVKNLVDAKTKRNCRRGVRADCYWYKDSVPKETLDAVRSGAMLDVSIGFTFDRVEVKGEFEGQKYDYIQDNIFLDHLAAPIPAGRCPGPVCGIGYDAKNISIDHQTVDACPVLAHMRDVGFGLASKRLYNVYGSDVIEAIDTGKLPIVEPPKTSIDQDFEKQLSEFNKWQKEKKN